MWKSSLQGRLPSRIGSCAEATSYRPPSVARLYAVPGCSCNSPRCCTDKNDSCRKADGSGSVEESLAMETVQDDSTITAVVALDGKRWRNGQAVIIKGPASPTLTLPPTTTTTATTLTTAAATTKLKMIAFERSHTIHHDKKNKKTAKPDGQHESRFLFRTALYNRRKHGGSRPYAHCSVPVGGTRKRWCGFCALHTAARYEAIVAQNDLPLACRTMTVRRTTTTTTTTATAALIRLRRNRTNKNKKRNRTPR